MPELSPPELAQSGNESAFGLHFAFKPTPGPLGTLYAYLLTPWGPVGLPLDGEQQINWN